MDKKEKILEAWIMVEHLSEGDIKLNDKDLKQIEISEDYNYYSMFYSEIQIQRKRLQNCQKCGVALYFNIFPFKKVVTLLRDKYNLPETYEEISVGDKFSFAIYFDKELKFVEEMTFFTASYYILKNGSIPKENEFLNFEKKNKEYINSIFACPEEEDYIEFFNKAFVKLLKKYSIQIEDSRMKVLSNLETDAINLHSFFVDDLEKAKSIKTKNLDSYLLGENKERVNLNSKADTSTFNPSTFEDILQPKNYPVARYPSDIENSLSLMQQIAVNLAKGYDNEKMRSVNGPPGTGKTTLLKDIFAELLVEQAYEITKLANKEISKNDKLKYYDKAYIGVMPSSIADKEIVVASSNNGAVQNIVNEFSLISKIDNSFVDELRKADYFWRISNSKNSTEWRKNKDGKPVEILKSEQCADEKFWGLLSLEGGKKDNIEGIITAIKHVYDYLNKEYEPNNKVYDDFLKRYKQVCEYKNERQHIADKYVNLLKLREQVETKRKNHEEKKVKFGEELKTIVEKNDADEVLLKQNLAEIEEQISICIFDIEKNIKETDNVEQSIKALELQKPFFLRFKARKEYKKRLYPFSEQLMELLNKKNELDLEQASLEKEKRNIEKALKENEQKVSVKKKENEKIIQLEIKEIQELGDKIKNISSELQKYSINELNMYIDYDSLQPSNPWFDEEYRKLQSKLFIDSLKVRKQFLYENRKSIKAGFLIWNRQKQYIDNKQVITEAWNWINMVIPIIGSTFASFSRMFANIETESLGYLFVDEAGQALPQSIVGSIFRSKKIMVVGDPAQIKPVLTLDSSILSMIGKHYGVSNKYLSDSASVQTLVDDISKYGFYKNDDEWIGIPLWVHRRCKNPMFDISNAISYGGNMVQSTDVLGKALWYDITGSASDKYVKEQGHFLKEKILEMIKRNPDIRNKSVTDVVYVISPFRNVAYHLSHELKEIGFTRYGNDGKPTNIGTVHTFQGKEADIVFLVLGCDEKSRGAARWAMSSTNPNIMNVAVTRAKEEFYIIGDLSLFMNINSDVINQTYSILKKFNSVETKNQTN
ncbi:MULTISPECIES: DEAD/DEAH box helicase [unclassified Parvimonas]|uniref:DEAD/DEAH box helicase n=1 Tax=unclassified Parvimonas TaxID=1151464 RepID=UPI002B47E521|nr:MULTISPECIES: AAA domain-containing protein [unclassified Parvimonas]MEB3025188.1 AAA domain-containing protein [Parvimonas sp. M13]MEB3089184.1 AAA domain-containing protein [Parvimonas sp. M20]